MTLLIGFLTFILVVNCLLLMLLILIQLPKKEAGAGIAFGGGATDALFGAGSGNALTKMTKYSASVFVGLALTLSLLNSNQAQEKKSKLDNILRGKENAAAPPPANSAGVNQLLNAPTQATPNAAAIALTNSSNALVTTLVSTTTNATATNSSPATNQTGVATNQNVTNPPSAPPK